MIIGNEYCELCEDKGCTECCPHDEHECYVCNDCGKELDPGLDIDRAMDKLDDR
jgi:hypothetical protein